MITTFGASLGQQLQDDHLLLLRQHNEQQELLGAIRELFWGLVDYPQPPASGRYYHGQEILQSVVDSLQYQATLQQLSKLG